MPDSTDIPDELFDADLVVTGETDREDWLLTETGLVRDPVIGLRWDCPECGDSGPMPDDPFDVVHGDQHAKRPFDPIVPLYVSAVRASDQFRSRTD